MFDNASEVSGYFYVKTIVLHNHSPDYRVLDHLSKTEEQIILLEREINSLTEEINACNQNIKDMQNKKSIQQWKITKKNKEMAKKKKEEKLRELRELPAIESEFHRSYGFNGYSEKNEIAYDKAYTSLQTHSLKAIQKYQARINNHKELVNAAKEYNRECDERADRTEPVVCNNDGFISYNISLNLPLTDLGRKLFAQKLYEGSFDMVNLNEYSDHGENSENGENGISGNENQNLIVDNEENSNMDYYYSEEDYSDSDGYYEEDCSESYDYRESDVMSDDFVMSDVGTEMSEINRSNPINIEALERDFRKDVKMDYTPLRNALHDLYFVNCVKAGRHYSAISRDNYELLHENSSKSLESVNDYYQNIEGMLSKRLFRKLLSKRYLESLKKNECIYNLVKLSNELL